MRHRIDITPETKMLLKDVAKELGEPNLGLSALTELCIQTAFHTVILNPIEMFLKDYEPILSKLDEIHSMLQEVLPEV